MSDVQQVIEQIRQAFRETEHPGDAFLQGSQEGCEPAEVTAPFKGVAHWSQVDAAILDPRATWADGAAYDAAARRLVAHLQALQPIQPVHALGGHRRGDQRNQASQPSL